MTEEEKLIIAKICCNEKLRKKYLNDVLEPDTFGVINYMLMNKTTVQKLEEPYFCLTKFFRIVELIAETQWIERKIVKVNKYSARSKCNS